MAVQFSCPQCGKVLKSSNPLTPGKKVKCPACAAIFSPAPAKAAAPVRKPPIAEDDETVDLRKTPSSASSPTSAPKKGGKPAPPVLEDEDEAELPRSKAAAKKTAPPIDDDDEDEEELPPRKSKAAIQAKKPAARIEEEDEEEDELPPARAKAGTKSAAVQAKKPVPPANDFGYEDEEMAEDLPPLPAKGKKAPPPPLKKGKGRDEEEDEFDEEEEDDLPKKKGKAEKGKAEKGKKKTNPKVLILAGVVVGVLALGAVAAFVWPGFLNSPGPKGPGKFVPPAGLPGPGPGGGGEAAALDDVFKYVPADAVAIAGINARGLREGTIPAGFYKMLMGSLRESTKNAPQELQDLAADAEEIINSIDRLLIAFLPGDADGNIPHLWVASFAAPVDIEKIQKVGFAKKVEGKEFYQEMSGAYYAKVEEQILVAGQFLSQNEFEKHLSDIGMEIRIQDDALKAQTAKVQDALAYLAISNSPDVQKQVGQFGDVTKFAPDEKLAAAAKAAMNSRALTFEVREDGAKLDIKLRFLCQSTEDAAAIEEPVREFMKGVLPGMLGFFLAQKDEMGQTPVPPELAKTIQSVVGTFNSGVEDELVWLSVSLSQADVNTIQAMAAMYLAAGGPEPVPMPKEVPEPDMP